MKRVELNKFNRQIYSLTFSVNNIPPMAQEMLKKSMCLNYKQYKSSIPENGYMSLHIMIVGEQFPTVDEIMASPLAKYIILATNYFGYGGTAEELIINYVHPLFLREKPPQVKRTIQIDVRPQLEYFLTIIGKQLKSILLL